MSWFNLSLLLIAISAGGVSLFRWYALSRGILDQPNKRSSHTISTPRGGGVVFSVLWIGFLGVMTYLSDEMSRMHWFFYLTAFSPAALIILLGYIDDLRGLSAKTRFIGQLLAAVASLWVIEESGHNLIPWHYLPDWIIFPLSLVAVTWMVNLVNFMDGSDGIAATEGIFVLGVGGYFLHQQGAYELATLSWGLVSLLTGFLLWNLPTARIFMGDSGSCFLGFVIAIIALIGERWFQLPIFYWGIIAGVFWFDATVTLVRRIMRGDKWLEAHREHAYQRLIQFGWSHGKVLTGVVVVNSLLSGLAIWAFHEPHLLKVAFGLALGFLGFIYLMVELARPMTKKWHGASTK